MSSTSNRWKILGILILAVVVLASVGSYVVLNRPISPSTVSSSSVLSVTQSSTTLLPVQWITVGQAKSKAEVTGGIPTSQMKQWLLYSGPTSRVY